MEERAAFKCSQLSAAVVDFGFSAGNVPGAHDAAPIFPGGPVIGTWARRYGVWELPGVPPRVFDRWCRRFLTDDESRRVLVAQRPTCGAHEAVVVSMSDYRQSKAAPSPRRS